MVSLGLSARGGISGHRGGRGGGAVPAGGVEPILRNAQQIKNTKSQLHATRHLVRQDVVFYVVEKWKIEMDIG